MVKWRLDKDFPVENWFYAHFPEKCSGIRCFSGQRQLISDEKRLKHSDFQPLIMKTEQHFNNTVSSSESKSKHIVNLRQGYICHWIEGGTRNKPYWFIDIQKDRVWEPISRRHTIHLKQDRKRRILSLSYMKSSAKCPCSAASIYYELEEAWGQRVQLCVNPICFSAKQWVNYITTSRWEGHFFYSQEIEWGSRAMVILGRMPCHSIFHILKSFCLSNIHQTTRTCRPHVHCCSLWKILFSIFYQYLNV